MIDKDRYVMVIILILIIELQRVVYNFYFENYNI